MKMSYAYLLQIDHIHLGTMLIVSIVHHGHRPFFPVFDAWYFLHIKKAGLVSIDFANYHTWERTFFSVFNLRFQKKVHKKNSTNRMTDL